MEKVGVLGMMDNIYGSFNTPRINDKYEQLWHKLAPQYKDETLKDVVAHNNGLTQKKNEIMELWQLFDRMQPHIILEIGVSQGGTFASWCQLAPDDALIIGLDKCVNDCRPHPGSMWLGALCGPVHPDIASPEVLRKTDAGGGIYDLKRKGSNQTIVAIDAWSYEDRAMIKLLEVLNGRKIDFCFHDASHEKSMTEKDFEMYWPLIAEGGAMAFHDICYCLHPDVTKNEWWEKIRKEGPQTTTYSYESRSNASFGIGVLFK